MRKDRKVCIVCSCGTVSGFGVFQNSAKPKTLPVKTKKIIGGASVKSNNSTDWLMKKIVPYFPETSAFLKADSRSNRWAIPYNYECLNSRVDILLGGNEDAIKGKRVLDIGSHIGTFSYAALKMGADFVHGVDTDEALIFKSNNLFETQGILSLNYKFEARDLFDYLEKLEPNSCDTILCFGILYYTADP